MMWALPVGAGRAERLRSGSRMRETADRPRVLSLSDLPVAVGEIPGGVAEWLKASRLKRDDRKVRGFESYPLRHTEAALRPRNLQ